MSEPRNGFVAVAVAVAIASCVAGNALPVPDASTPGVAPVIDAGAVDACDYKRSDACIMIDAAPCDVICVQKKDGGQ